LILESDPSTVAASTRTLLVDPDHPDRSILDEAARILRSGGLVAFGTETVYGLGADATSPAAVARIFEAKGRPAYNPLIVHAATAEMARRCVSAWPEPAERLAQRFWPGPLTLVLPRSAMIPDIVTAGRATVAVRVPAPAVARELIARAGRPLAAPSANRSTGVSPTLARHVLDDLDGRIDLILDSGATTHGLESTVLDLTPQPPRLLRPGALPVALLEEALGGVAIEQGVILATDRPSSPGQLAIHYAPRTPAIRVGDPDAFAQIAWPGRSALVVIGYRAWPNPPGNVPRIDLDTPEATGRSLYALLRDLDAKGLDLIVIVPPPDQPEWQAIRDRLWRATRERFRAED
jgi:L-threonylcarbamoyladenylate synthase